MIEFDDDFLKELEEKGDIDEAVAKVMNVVVHPDAEEMLEDSLEYISLKLSKEGYLLPEEEPGHMLLYANDTYKFKFRGRTPVDGLIASIQMERENYIVDINKEEPVKPSKRSMQNRLEVYTRMFPSYTHHYYILTTRDNMHDVIDACFNIGLETRVIPKQPLN